MTGVIKRVTTNFNLGIPYFDRPNWGSVFERNMNIIDAVLATAGVVSGVVGAWQTNTTYGVDDRVVDETSNTVWQCAVAHTSGNGTFAQDRINNPTYWDPVNSSIVVREEFQTGSDYFAGDFVFDTDEYLGGIVLQPFTGGANLREDIANLGVIYDFKTLITQFNFPDPAVADTYLRRNAGNTAYEAKTAAEVADELVDEMPVVRYDQDDGRTPAEQSQARANIGAGVLSGREILINPTLQLWQRGITLGSGTGARVTADRFVYDSIGTAYATSRGTFTLGQTDVPGNPFYYMHIDVASVAGAANFCLIKYSIEDVTALAGQQFTFSFYAKANNPNTPISVEFNQTFGIGGSPSPAVQAIGVTKHTLSTSWDRYDVVVNIPSIAGKTLGTSGREETATTIHIWLDAGSNYNSRTDTLGQRTSSYDFAMFGLARGDATNEPLPFEYRSFQQERFLCERYYQRLIGYHRVFASGAGNFTQTISFRQRMRVVPAVALAGSPATNNISNEGIAGSSIDGLRWNMISAGAGDTYILDREFVCNAEFGAA